MECILCTFWNQMPYAKRHTTPTSAQDTEAALVVGYWVHSRIGSTMDVAPRICDRHFAILDQLDQRESQRTAIQAPALPHAAVPTGPAPLHMPLAPLTAQPPPVPTAPFGAFQTSITAQPPMPNAEPPKQNGPTVTGPEVMATNKPDNNWQGWYCTNHPAGEYHANTNQRQTCWGCGLARPGGLVAQAVAGTPEAVAFDPVKAALEAAKAPAQEGRRMETFPCPKCGATISPGDAHQCQADKTT